MVGKLFTDYIIYEKNAVRYDDARLFLAIKEENE